MACVMVRSGCGPRGSGGRATVSHPVTAPTPATSISAQIQVRILDNIFDQRSDYCGLGQKVIQKGFSTVILTLILFYNKEFFSEEMYHQIGIQEWKL